MTTFFIADTHFGHKSIINFRHKPSGYSFESFEEHDEYLIERWNAVVTKRDTVWVLGDVAWNKRSLQHFARLRGTKRVVLGNHDTLGAHAYLEHFVKLYGAAEAKFNGLPLLLTHIPAAPQQVRPRYEFNIHGHTHTRYGPSRTQHICVSADHIGLTPVALETLIHDSQSRSPA